MSAFSAGNCIHANLECPISRHLSQPSIQLHTLQPRTRIHSFQTCKEITPISCTGRKRELRTMEIAACSLNGDGNMSTDKVYEKGDGVYEDREFWSMEDASCSSNVDGKMSANKFYEKSDGILIVDHGSRRAQSNAMIHTFVDMFKLRTGHSNVEPAHMELASPSIKEAFDKCVRQGATKVIITPYFLSPGRHWDKDIPALAAEAAKGHKNVSFIVTAPIGLHALMVDILQERINRCLSQASGEMPECDMCAGTGRCKLIQPFALSEREEFTTVGKEP